MEGEREGREGKKEEIINHVTAVLITYKEGENA